MFGLVLLIVGIVWFMQSLGLIDSTIWGILLPLVMIAFGLKILNRHAYGEKHCMMCGGHHDCCDREGYAKTPETKITNGAAVAKKKVVKSKAKK
jgi:hypothetical protein